MQQEMVTSVAHSPYFRVFQAAQIKAGDKGLLSRDISVLDLIVIKCDVHHLYPRNYLKKHGLPRGKYNQIANYAVMQSEINIAIGDKPPRDYFADALAQCSGGTKRYGGITNRDELHANLRSHCIPQALLSGTEPDYEDFLAERRRLMGIKLREYFRSL